MPACTLAGHDVGHLGLTCAKEPSDDLVADHELVLGPLFWLWFSYHCRLKLQVPHGKAFSGLKGGGVSSGVPWGGLSPHVQLCRLWHIICWPSWPGNQGKTDYGVSLLPLNHSGDGRGAVP